MGNSESKSTPEPSHVWKSETPVRFSQGLVDSLTGSNETDSSRAKTLELHIQARVASELKKLAEKEDKLYAEISEKLSAEPKTKSAGDHLRNLSRESVQADVNGLREKLEKRKKVRAMEEIDQDGALNKARNDVVKCLRGNDRKPLDCYAEVEAFKREVGRVEGRWVEKIVR